ncbi:MAG: 2,3-cyclic 3-phosphodiesterase [Solirubrobacteraceae bacterium]|nr:2,3-cyclic 3-phosphodiesterase [Solirubrobacteraceae bacterium]
MSEPALRLFVALELAAEAREELVRWRSLALGRGLDPAVRAVAPEDLHVTLCFLGAQPRSALAPVLDVCAQLGSPPAAGLRLGHGLWLPRRSPRVLAVGLEDDEGRLGDVRARLSAGLAAGGWYRPEARPYLPHVTVGRVRRGAPVTPGRLLAPEPVAFAGRRVSLYRSVLARAGARYEVLGGVELGG